MDDKNNTDPSQFLTFMIAGEEFAVGILQVREIIEFGTVTRIPSVPACIRGVINLRGSVVPVVDLAVKFGLPDSQVTRWTCIVVMEVMRDGEPTVMGIMADAVNQVIELQPGDIEPPPGFGTRVRVDFLLGMGKVGRKFALILDVPRVLSTEELLSTTTLTADAAEQPAEEPLEEAPA